MHPPPTDAFLATTYHVDASGPGEPVGIRIGHPTPVLDAWLATLDGVHPAWVHITAYNPLSQARTPEVNAARDAHLQAHLAALGRALAEHDRRLQIVPGRGTSADGQWSEEGWLVAGLTRDEALALGALHGQWAVVTGSPGAPAALTWVVQPPVTGAQRVLAPAADFCGSGEDVVAALREVAESGDAGPIRRAAAGPWVQCLEEADCTPTYTPSCWLPVRLHATEDDPDTVAADLLTGAASLDDEAPPSELRAFVVHWPDGISLAVGMLLDSDAARPLAVALGPDPLTTQAALLAGSAHLLGETDDPGHAVIAAEALAAMINAR